jgi:oligopeptide transport system ATP-binding protein
MSAPSPPTQKPLLSVRRLKVHYPQGGTLPWTRQAPVRAVDDVHFNLYPGETLGIVGESGCGKSTLARALVGLQPVTSGGIAYEGRDLAKLDESGWRALRREIQMIFQDPLASLDPRMTIGEIVAEPLTALCPELDESARKKRVAEMLDHVGLSARHINRYPHEFSGGQCQRVGIARALIVRPKILICDEPVSALDVSVQAQIINLLAQLQREHGLSLLFIAHDLAVVRHISHRVLVMYLGRVMEQATRDDLFAQPRHPYTRALLASAPEATRQAARNRTRTVLEGELPSPADPPSGCVFRTRCPIADSLCAREVPYLRHAGGSSHAACHYVQGAAAAAEPDARPAFQV